jgi:hypothetical protein
MLLGKPRSGQQLGRWGLVVGWLMALAMAACGHAAGSADQAADGACLLVDGSIGGPPPANCPNDFPSATDCPDASPSYKTDIAPTVRDKCTVCHTPGGIEPVPVFGSYAEIHAQTTQNSVRTFVFSCRMPPTCAPQLTADERKKMLKWLACGALDN